MFLSKCLLLAALLILSFAGHSQAPQITSVSPLSTPPGTAITITGANFSNVPANNIVYFGEAKAQVISSNSTAIEATLPASPTSGAVSVTVNHLTGYYYPQVTAGFPSDDGAITQQSFKISNLFSTPSIRDVKKLADFDNDGKNELICIYNNNVFIYRIGSSMQFPFATLALTLPVPALTTFALADIDGDGKKDLITGGNYLNEQNRVAVYINTSSGGQFSFAPAVELGDAGTDEIVDIQAADFNMDGKPDLVFTNNQTSHCRVLQNTTENGIVSFAVPATELLTQYTPMGICVTDLDGDGKPEIAVTNINSHSITYFLNTSGSNISFAEGISKLNGMGMGVRNILAADMDRDGREDLVVTSSGVPGKVSVFRNISTTGNLLFEDAKLFATGPSPRDLSITDFDGDGLLDITVANTDTTGPNAKSVSVLKNISSPGLADFSPSAYYQFIKTPTALTAGDVDGDSKPDILITTGLNISILLNRTGYPVLRSTCAGQPVGFRHLSAGTSYQWQLNTGSGFQDISNSSLYSGTSTDSLAISAVTTAMDGYVYRCVTNVDSSGLFGLDIANEWMGTVNSNWENPANWSCGTVPDAQTNVHLTGGTCTINVNTTIYSLTISNGAILTVASGVHLNILH